MNELQFEITANYHIKLIPFCSDDFFFTKSYFQKGNLIFDLAMQADPSVVCTYLDVVVQCAIKNYKSVEMNSTFQVIEESGARIIVQKILLHVPNQISKQQLFTKGQTKAIIMRTKNLLITPDSSVETLLSSMYSLSPDDKRKVISLLYKSLSE